MSPINLLLQTLRYLACIVAFTSSVLAVQPSEPKPLRALLIAGGCCHDYALQQEILSSGIQARALVRVDVVWTDAKSVTPEFPLYERNDWADGYDVIIHNECAAGIKDLALIQRIIDAHRTKPAVNLHCAVHSYRSGSDIWFKYLGLQSSGHGPQEPIEVTITDRAHPITAGLKEWTTEKEELYNNIRLFDAQPLASGRQQVKGEWRTSVVAWINEKQGARTFTTTLGHNNVTVADSRYLDLVTRGLLWACDRLEPSYLKSYTGPNTVTFIKASPENEKPTPRKPRPATP